VINHHPVTRLNYFEVARAAFFSKYFSPRHKVQSSTRRTSPLTMVKVIGLQPTKTRDELNSSTVPSKSNDLDVLAWLIDTLNHYCIVYWLHSGCKSANCQLRIARVFAGFVEVYVVCTF